jgi:hypothetical protein
MVTTSSALVRPSGKVWYLTGAQPAVRNIALQDKKSGKKWRDMCIGIGGLF